MPTTDLGTSPLVGFDLDMTLIDSRPGIKAVYDELAARTGVAIDSDLVVSRLGPPVEVELGHWFAASDVPEMADLYRALYPDLAIERVRPLPGAAVAFEAVRARGARLAVITAKNTADAARHLDHLGLRADEVRGRAWRSGKADALRELGAVAYVGDHVHDMEAAQLAGVPGLAVSTGPCTPAELAAAGASRVVGSLEELPAVLDAVWPPRAVA
ncbi:HAD family hydrolase [Mumia sp. zg.B17]|uniref:HAD family hydrolase n=1 Tax=Mumia sp. zg.B17 TaxID=2855446 RepID=UPI0027E39330|nr:HAD family hydrolase [Mumia sp. zg.B17]